MMQTARTARVAAATAGLLLIYTAAAVLTRAGVIPARVALAVHVGVTLDLTVTASAVVYLLLVRPGQASGWILVPVFAAGLLTARALVPGAAASKVALGLALAWGAVELTLVTLFLLRLRRVVRRTRELRAGAASLIGALEESLLELVKVPLLASALAVEVGALAHAALGWFQTAPRVDEPCFSVHRERRWGALVGVFAFLVVVETTGLHIALTHLSPIVAWISTLTSVYALLWLIGDYQALRLQPLVLGDDELIVEVGIRWRLRIAYADLAAVTAIDERPARRSYLDAALLAPNVLLTLRAPVTARGPFGLRREASRVALTVDRREAFVAALRARLGEPRPAASA